MYNLCRVKRRGQTHLSYAVLYLTLCEALQWKLKLSQLATSEPFSMRWNSGELTHSGAY